MGRCPRDASWRALCRRAGGRSTDLDLSDASHGVTGAGEGVLVVRVSDAPGWRVGGDFGAPGGSVDAGPVRGWCSCGGCGVADDGQ